MSHVNITFQFCFTSKAYVLLH